MTNDTKSPSYFMVYSLISSLATLSLGDTLPPGEVVEMVEMICSEQNYWKENSSGWRVLEALKDYIRDNN